MRVVSTTVAIPLWGRGMFRSSAILFGIAGPAFLLGAVAQGPIRSAASVVGGAIAPTSAVAQGEMARAPKGDLLRPVRRPSEAARPATVEVVGLGPSAVILRDKGGTILYRSDDSSNTTFVAKNADLPVITVKERVESPVTQRPAPSAAPEGERIKAGCEGIVSALVGNDARRIPSRCVVELDGPAQTRPVRLAMQ